MSTWDDMPNDYEHAVKMIRRLHLERDRAVEILTAERDQLRAERDKLRAEVQQLKFDAVVLTIAGAVAVARALL